MGVGALLLFSYLWPSTRRGSHGDPEMAMNPNDTPEDEGEYGDGEDNDHGDELDHDHEDTIVRPDPDDIDHESPTIHADSWPPPDPPNTQRSWLSRLKAVLFPTSDDDDGDQRFIPNYRILPIISGIIIPFSILLEIPGLTGKWYIRTEDGEVVETKPNTVILEVGLGISMFCALIANLCVILRFLEKGGVKTMTILAIIALTVHDTINMIAIVVFGVEHRFSDGFTYGPGYWSTVCSTIASTTTNLTLAWDFFATPNFARSGSGLTRKQRSLVIIVITLLCYIALGALVNSFLLALDFINALYFTVVSIETVGFGDIVPINTGSRVFICLYIAFGIVNLGVAIAICRETVFEQLEVSYRKRMAVVRQRRADHRKWRAWERAWKLSVEWRLKQMEAPEWVKDDEFDKKNVKHPNGKQTSGALIGRMFFKLWPHGGLSSFKSCGQVRGLAYGHPGTHLNIEALSPVQLEAAAVEAGVPLDAFYDLRQHYQRARSPQNAESQSASSSTMFNIFKRPHCPPQQHEPVGPVHREFHKMSAMLTKFAFASTGVGINPQSTPHLKRHESPGFLRPVITPTQTSRIRGELSSGLRSTSVPASDFKQSMESEETKAFWAKLVVALALFLAFWLAGAGIFSATEQWSIGIAVYFCFITFTTTGYGDYAPTTPAGRAVFVVWALLGLAAVAILVSILQDAFSSRYKSAMHSGAFHKAVKKYRQRDKKRRPFSASFSPALPPSTTNLGVSAVRASNERAQRQLEALPTQVLRHSKTFYKHVEYFVHHNSSMGYREGGGNEEVAMPVDLRLILDEIASEQHLEDRVKNEILQDEEARNTLFMLSFERVLREMTEVAEGSLVALAERDRLKARHQQRDSSREGSGAVTPDTTVQQPKLGPQSTD